MNRKEKKDLERIYKEVYRKAYEENKASALQKEITRINKQARMDARRDLAKKYSSKPKQSKNLGKKAKKHGKDFSKRAKKIGKAGDVLAKNLRGW